MEPVGVGDSLVEMPLFIADNVHVLVPLEATYQAAWEASPEMLRVAVEMAVVPDPDTE